MRGKRYERLFRCSIGGCCLIYLTILAPEVIFISGVALSVKGSQLMTAKGNRPGKKGCKGKRTNCKKEHQKICFWNNKILIGPYLKKHFFLNNLTFVGCINFFSNILINNNIKKNSLTQQNNYYLIKILIRKQYFCLINKN